MELNKAASALVSAWQSASHFTCDKYCLNMLAKMLSSLKLNDYIYDATKYPTASTSLLITV